MLLTDVWRLDGFLAQYPPVDLLFAAWIKYESPAAARKDNVVPIRERGKRNAQALAALPPKLQPNVARLPKLAQMPAFLRTPESLAMIEQARAQANG